MSGVLREKELKRRHSRKLKLRRLRDRYQTAKSDDEKTYIVAKARKAAPWLSEQEFLAPIKQ